MQLEQAPATQCVPVIEVGNDADRTRQLVQAANEILDESGLDGLTIRAVLKRAGFARRAFYERFVGKDDLLLAVFKENFCEATDHFSAQIEGIASPIERLRVVVVGLVAGAFDDDAREGRVAAMVREYLRLSETRPGELQSALKPLLAFIAEHVAAGIREGQVRECDPLLQATLIYNMIATTLHTELLVIEKTGWGTAYKEMLPTEIWEFCRRALMA